MAKTPSTTPVRQLRVLHTQLGSWPKGHVLPETDLPHPALEIDRNGKPIPEEVREAERNANVQRLIDIGAVEVVKEAKPEDKTGPAPLGPDSIHAQKAEAMEEKRWGDGNHPLNFFDGKDDDTILAYKGIGPAGLKEIRDAQAAQKK